MKKFIFVFLILVFMFSACSSAMTESEILTTATISPTVTYTSTPNITPLPTIPTFTPTFDVSKIVTVTPAEKAECSKEVIENNIPLDFEIYPNGNGKFVNHSNINIILNYLNSGGSISVLENELANINANFLFQDVTNDRLPDLILVSGLGFQHINIFYCRDGQYILFPKDINEGESLGSDEIKFTIEDINQNNIFEIISIGSGKGLEINILEWNNTTFSQRELFTKSIEASEEFRISDLNNDGVDEIIISGMPNYWYYPGEPLRYEFSTYSWNGKSFTHSVSFDFPEYRFQSIQDGDNLSLQGKFKEAQVVYQTSIKSNILDWWSRERFETNKNAILNFSTPPALTPDPVEYPSLASYAYYRIMLLQLVQGQETEANQTYQTLLDTFGNDPYAKPYIEMTKAFLEAYQVNQKMYDGCAAAIQYAVEHPEILVPLGSDYHGSQAKIYKPEDICPFR